MLVLKLVAPLNMFAMLVAAAVLQLAMFWLNADADWKAPCRFATRATLQLPMFALKADAPLKMLAMFETDATFHLLPQ
jgi:hypothetical protein